MRIANRHLYALLLIFFQVFSRFNFFTFLLQNFPLNRLEQWGIIELFENSYSFPYRVKTLSMLSLTEYGPSDFDPCIL